MSEEKNKIQKIIDFLNKPIFETKKQKEEREKKRS